MSVFSSIDALHPKRHNFDLSHEHKLTCDMGELLPVCAMLTLPGDYFKISARAVVRFQPMFAPIMHDVSMKMWYFYVPIRLLGEKMGFDFETFINGGVTGNETVVLPRWNPTDTAEGSLWDYFGFPTGVNPSDDTLSDGSTFYAKPLDFLRSSYNLIFNEYFRDQNVDDELELDSEVVQNVRWKKDYFTSALPWTQRGTAPAMPISISGSVSPSVVFSGSSKSNVVTVSQPVNLAVNNGLQITAGTSGGSATGSVTGKVTVNGSSFEATSFDVNDVRLAFQIQKWMERNARSGSRYTEYLRSHFGVAPADDRLQRPEYIGGSTAPIVVSEVLQTSQTDSGGTAQGNMAGHGIAAGSGKIGNYFSKEFGVIIGLMAIVPKPAYQNGINRQWLMQSRYDWYVPEFANLGEQEVFNEEIYAQASAGNGGVFGFQERFNELRYMPSTVHGQMRSTLDYWHLGRIFEDLPNLNTDFLTCAPSKRIFAVQDEDSVIVDYGNLISAARPLPVRSDPGLIDHTYGGR